MKDEKRTVVFRKTLVKMFKDEGLPETHYSIGRLLS